MEYYGVSHYGLFKDWVSRYSGKTFDLNESKDKIVQDFYFRFMQGDYDDVREFAKAILKSYMLKNENEVLPYVSVVDLKITKPIELIDKFLNEYVVSNKVEDKNFQGVCSTIGEILAEKTEDIYGDFVYADILNYRYHGIPSVKKSVLEYFKKKNYTSFAKDQRFLKKNDTQAQAVVKPENQPFLATEYPALVNRYILSWQDYVKKNASLEDYETFWNTVGNCLNNMELHMSDETKSLPDVKKARAYAENFFMKEKEELKNKLTKEGKNGAYYMLVKNSINRFKDGVANEKDANVLNGFYKNLMKVYRGLSICDEKGSYPTNYFVAMPIHPTTVLELISSFQKSGFLNDEKNERVGMAKSEIRRNFPNNIFGRAGGTNTGIDCDSYKVLHSYRTKTVFPDGRIKDYINEENYKRFVNTVDGYINGHDLPHYEVCILTVAKDLYHDRSPLMLPGDIKFYKFDAKESGLEVKEQERTL